MIRPNLIATIAIGCALVGTAAIAGVLPGFQSGPSTSSTQVVKVGDDSGKGQAANAATSDQDEKPLGPGPTHIATFAAGCFWCTESDFDKVDGVLRTVSGFTGGTTANPTYSQVTSGLTDHTEAVQIIYDPTKVTYEKLLDVYWKNVDPFDLSGQFCDRGSTYRPAIFAHNEEQKRLALASRKRLNESGKFDKKIELPVQDAGAFTAAGEQHQNFYKKNSFHYYRYRVGCGRDARLQEIWGKKGA